MGLFRFFGSNPSEDGSKVDDSGPEKPVSATVDTHQPPKFDAVAVLEAAKVDAKQRERVDRTLELLNALPAETPAAIRKTIVEASLKAFDISIKAIVESANAEVNAFDAFINAGHKQLDDLKKQSLARIAELQAEIAQIQKRLEVATADQASLDQSTVAAMDKVRPILGFFGDVSNRNSLAPANSGKGEHPPSIIVDEELMKVG
jgi:hypothetical protein